MCGKFERCCVLTPPHLSVGMCNWYVSCWIDGGEDAISGMESRLDAKQQRWMKRVNKCLWLVLIPSEPRSIINRFSSTYGCKLLKTHHHRLNYVWKFLISNDKPPVPTCYLPSTHKHINFCFIADDKESNLKCAKIVLYKPRWSLSTIFHQNKPCEVSQPLHYPANNVFADLIV